MGSKWPTGGFKTPESAPFSGPPPLPSVDFVQIIPELGDLEVVLSRDLQVINVPKHSELLPTFGHFVGYTRIVRVDLKPVRFQLLPELAVEENRGSEESVKSYRKLDI